MSESEKKEQTKEEKKKLPLAIFEYAFEKRLGSIGKFFGFDILDPGYKTTLPTYIWGSFCVFTFGACVKSVLSIEPGQSIFCVAEACAIAQVM